MPIVEAICPECGAKIKVNSNAKGELRCPFCGSSFDAQSVLNGSTSLSNSKIDEISENEQEAAPLFAKYRSKDFLSLDKMSDEFMVSHPNNPYGYLFQAIATAHAANPLKLTQYTWCSYNNDLERVTGVATPDFNTSCSSLIPAVRENYIAALKCQTPTDALLDLFYEQLNQLVEVFNGSGMKRGLLLKEGYKSTTQTDNPRAYLCDYLLEVFPDFISELVDELIKMGLKDRFKERTKEFYLSLKKNLVTRENLRIYKKLGSTFAKLEEIIGDPIDVEIPKDPELEKVLNYRYITAVKLARRMEMLEKIGLGIFAGGLIFAVAMIWAEGISFIGLGIMLVGLAIFAFAIFDEKKRPAIYRDGHCDACHGSLEAAEIEIESVKTTMNPIEFLAYLISKGGNSNKGHRVKAVTNYVCPYCENKGTKIVQANVNRKGQDKAAAQIACANTLHDAEHIPFFNQIGINEVNEALAKDANALEMPGSATSDNTAAFEKITKEDPLTTLNSTTDIVNVFTLALNSFLSHLFIIGGIVLLSLTPEFHLLSLCIIILGIMLSIYPILLGTTEIIFYPHGIVKKTLFFKTVIEGNMSEFSIRNRLSIGVFSLYSLYHTKSNKCIISSNLLVLGNKGKEKLEEIGISDK